MIRSERQRKAMFAQMQSEMRQRYQGLTQKRRHQIAGAAAATAGLGVLKAARSPAGQFALQVAKIGLIAKAIKIPGKVARFGLKAHKVGWTRRQLRKASTVGEATTGLYVTRKGHVLNPRHVEIAMLPFRKRMTGLVRSAI